MDKIFLNQIKILKKVKNYNKLLSKDIDPSLSPLTYMTAWAETPGYYKLNSLIHNFKIRSYIFFLKDIFLISFHHSLKAFKKKNFSEDNKTKNLIVSYCEKKNFDKNGNFYDYYFNTSSKNNKYLWLLISLDNYIPVNIKENLIIISKDSSIKYNFYFFIKSLIKIVLKKKEGVTKFFHWANSSYVFSSEVTKIFDSLLKKLSLKNIIINYESVPFQNSIINKAKKFNKDIKIICYLHCAGWPLQTDLLFRNKKIDKLLVSGIDQKRKLVKYLNWPSKKIINIPSIRFEKNKKTQFGGKIFIPFNIFDEKTFLAKFENFLKITKEKSLNKLGYSIHPLNKKSLKHKKFKSKMQSLIYLYKNRFSSFTRRKTSIIFGSATGVCIQALESGVDIIHFPGDINLDVFNNKMWPNIKTKNFNNEFFMYSIKKFNKTFWTINQKNKFEKYLACNL